MEVHYSGGSYTGKCGLRPTKEPRRNHVEGSSELTHQGTGRVEHFSTNSRPPLTDWCLWGIYCTSELCWHVWLVTFPGTLESCAAGKWRDYVRVHFRCDVGNLLYWNQMDQGDMAQGGTITTAWPLKYIWKQTRTNHWFIQHSWILNGSWLASVLQVPEAESKVLVRLSLVWELWEKSASKLLHIVGGIQFLLVVGLRCLFSHWLSGSGHFSF